MKIKSEKGMLKRTFGIFFNIRIPWPLYILQVALGIVSTKVALLYIPYQTDLKLGNIEDTKTVWSYIGFLLLASVVQIISSIPSFYASAMVGRNLQNKLILSAVHLPMKSFESKASQLVSWITQDCAYADGLLTSVIGFFTGAASTYMTMTSMSAIDSSLIYIVPILLAYIIFSTWFEGRMLFLRERRGRLANAELTAYMSEHLGFFTQIKQLHAHDEEKRRGKQAIDMYYKAEVYQSVLTLINNFVAGSITNIISILVFVLGIPRVKNGNMTIAELSMFQSYILLAYQSFSSLPQLYSDLMYYGGQLFYIGNLMSETPEKYKRERSMDMEDMDLDFENVTFGYGDKPVIKNATFKIPKGKITVVAGPNGSGKTTLFKLIERFYSPDSGKIYFGPIDTRSIHLDEWRQSFAYVLQEPQLFDGTVRDNINYGMTRAVSEQETESAAILACADEFIRELPEGYDFEIGENGSRLSAGQRQRLAIARAVMLDPSYLLLDEATSNMDVYSQKAVTKALSNLMRGRTTVMISHDMSALEKADHVIVLNDGCVEAEGTREQAMENSPTLRALLQANE